MQNAHSDCSSGNSILWALHHRNKKLKKILLIGSISWFLSLSWKNIHKFKSCSMIWIEWFGNFHLQRETINTSKCETINSNSNLNVKRKCSSQRSRKFILSFFSSCVVLSFFLPFLFFFVFFLLGGNLGVFKLFWKVDKGSSIKGFTFRFKNLDKN